MFVVLILAENSGQERLGGGLFFLSKVIFEQFRPEISRVHLFLFGDTYEFTTPIPNPS